VRRALSHFSAYFLKNVSSYRIQGLVLKMSASMTAMCGAVLLPSSSDLLRNVQNYSHTLHVDKGIPFL
jgi:hypothetical protein